MKILPAELEVENGDPAISLLNIIKGVQYWGSPVGAIHTILPNDDQVTHIYFYDGWKIFCLGFSIGYVEGMDKSIFTKVFSFQQALNLIPGWPAAYDDQYLVDLGVADLGKKETTRYVLRIHGQKLLKLIDDCPGSIALSNHIEIEKLKGKEFK